MTLRKPMRTSRRASTRELWGIRPEAQESLPKAGLFVRRGGISLLEQGMKLEVCRGCGLALDPGQKFPKAQFHSSDACWAQYGMLAAWTLTLADPSFPHQHAVDAYAAQHVGPESRPIQAVFALCGICLALEHGATGRQVQLAHMKMGKARLDWPAWVPRTRQFDLTVKDLLRIPEGKDRLSALRPWMECAWSAWSHEQEEVRKLLKSLSI
jgi:hypothetical protein